MSEIANAADILEEVFGSCGGERSHVGVGGKEGGGALIDKVVGGLCGEDDHDDQLVGVVIIQRVLLPLVFLKQRAEGLRPVDLRGHAIRFYKSNKNKKVYK